MTPSDALPELLLDHVQDGVCFVGTDQIVTYWNKGAERITGYIRNEVVGNPCRVELLGAIPTAAPPENAEACPALAVLHSVDSFEDELIIIRKDGETVRVFARISPILTSTREVIGVVEVFSDDASRIQALERIRELEELALLCPLTEVGNRRYTEMALQASFEELLRYSTSFGILFADIDRFKAINDNFGHGVGDQVLRMVAHALRSSLRPFDFVGRWGGEEFVVILPNINQDRLTAVAHRCHALIQEASYQHDGVAIQVTASFGAALARPDEAPKDLLDRADRLMYQSKANGRNRVTVGL